MQYFITFLEGVVSFLSPCMLPMLPVYVSYFAAGSPKKSRAFVRSGLFVLGFTAVFTLMGLFAGTVGGFLSRHQRWVDLVCGLVVILFGLSYLEVIRLPFLKGVDDVPMAQGLFSAFLFGMIYSVSLTPCVGAFLGSALMLAGSAGGAGKGALLLLVYSAGLGIPFVLSTLLLHTLQDAFDRIKRHYTLINRICGGALVLLGLLMASGQMSRLLALFS
ncbi:MAG: cytochrome c biogenesis protein CcdA [Oscillospiraceae bacterium]|nr:cytochrome c biogenesis protein CcdA [Oscillospiraceae bacterium]MBR2637037.1 cytochrome c biogenesis protein CcdA [Oscillospiraceae bacterium]MBR6608165.1 cytochrome c biogenesis protein CcdA [Oscillospiraceae bacterium]